MTTSAVHDLKTLVLSFHPVIAVDTVEEARLVDLLDGVANELALPFYEWSINEGLVQRGEGGFANRSTAEPLALLRHLSTLRMEALYLLKDFAVHLADPTARRAFPLISTAPSSSRRRTTRGTATRIPCGFRRA